AGDEIFAIDPETLENRPQRKPSFPALEMVSNIENLPERLSQLFNVRDRSAEFIKKLLISTFEYAAARIPEISDSYVAVDRAMQWGFAWEMGPFELWKSLQTAPAAVITGLDKEANVPLPAGFVVLKNERAIKSNAGATLRDLGDGVACLE